MTTSYDNSDRTWRTSEEWRRLAEMSWLKAFIQIGDDDIAQAEDRYHRVEERVRARLRTVERDRRRREKRYG